MVEQTLIKLVSEFVFGGLAVYLIITGRNDSKEREDKLIAHNETYQQLIREQTESQKELVGVIKMFKNEIKDDIQDIKDLILRK